MPNTYHDTNKPEALNANEMVLWNSGTNNFTIVGGDKETRPVNAYVNFIIKLTDSAPLLVGSIVSYAGNDNSTVTLNDNWLPCDGNQYQIPRYPELAKTLRGRYSTTTNRVGVPKLAGQFLRGVDGNAKRDPDAHFREAAPDGTTGNNVGTIQAYATSARGLTVSIPHFPPESYHKLYHFPNGNVNLHRSEHEHKFAFYGGSKESRPTNVMVDHYILAQEPTDPTEFPLGGIIAIPGTGGLDSDYWTPADGRSILIDNNPDLFAVLKNAWGAASDGLSFNLPNLNNMFLRGTDNTPPNVEDPWGDPERWSRTASAPGGVTSGTGSKQGFETGDPKHTFAIVAGYPVKSDGNAKTPAHVACSAYNSGVTTYNVQGGDAETAPISLAVAFYIKTKNSSSAAHAHQAQV